MTDPFAVLARCLGVLCALVSVAWSGSLLTLAGFHGIVDPSLAQWSASVLPLALQRYLDPSSQFDSALVGLSSLVALLGAALFWRPRSAVVAALLYVAVVCFKQTTALMAYGVFEFLQLGLFYVVAANVAGAAFASNESRRSTGQRLVGGFFRAHLAMAYLSSGLCKAVGPQWWSGESMWRALARSDNSGQRWFHASWTGNYPVLLQVVGIATLSLEILYPLAFFRRLRPWIVLGVCLMHLGTIAFQGLTLFGLTMISLNVFFLLESRAFDALRGSKDGEEKEQAGNSVQPTTISVLAD